jgi:hypothetical protein
VIPIHKKSYETDCSNYQAISLLPTSYKILSTILLSRLTPYADEIIGKHQRGFRPNIKTTAQIFYIRQIMENMEYKSRVHQLSTNFKKAYESVTKEVLYNILIEFRIPVKKLG